MLGITISLEILTFITGLVFYKKIKPKIYRLMVLLLFITVANELCSSLKFYDTIGLPKAIAYNTFFVVNFCLINIIYFVADKYQRWFVALQGCILFAAICLLVIKGAKIIHPTTISLLCIGLIVAGFRYLYKLYASGNVLSLKKDTLLFFSIGLIAVQFVLLFYVNARRIDSFMADENWVVIFRSLNLTGNIVYYLLIIYSFICSSIYRQRVGIS